ncbi:MAG: hypothetical protein HQK76_19415 [Desulfobacterales bacterium]|nr:hypothetical protein [Desulfobacterales bacterium]
MKILKVIINELDLSEWDSFCFDREQNLLFICNSNNFPLLKYRIPFDRHKEFDGQGEKFDVQQKIINMKADDPKIVIERIPTKGWQTLSIEALKQLNLRNYSRLLLLVIEKDESIPTDVILKTNEGFLYILANALNINDISKTDDVQFAIALYFE